MSSRPNTSPHEDSLEIGEKILSLAKARLLRHSKLNRVLAEGRVYSKLVGVGAVAAGIFWMIRLRPMSLVQREFMV